MPESAENAELKTLGTAEVRERVLETASALFYRRGVRAVGVDLVVEEAGVAKTSLYRHFRTKDDLVAAFLEREDEDFWAHGIGLRKDMRGMRKRSCVRICHGLASASADRIIVVARKSTSLRSFRTPIIQLAKWRQRTRSKCAVAYRRLPKGLAPAARTNLQDSLRCSSMAPSSARR